MLDGPESQKEMQQKLYGATAEGGAHVSPYHSQLTYSERDSDHSKVHQSYS